jgi:hypothetical protein
MSPNEFKDVCKQARRIPLGETSVRSALHEKFIIYGFEKEETQKSSQEKVPPEY